MCRWIKSIFGYCWRFCQCLKIGLPQLGDTFEPPAAGQTAIMTFDQSSCLGANIAEKKPELGLSSLSRF